MAQQSSALTGASVKLYINNRVFGIVTGFEWTTSDGHRAIMGLDQNTPFELAPGSQTVKGRVDCIRARQDGGLEGRGVAATDFDLLLEKYISILLVDRLTGAVIFRCDQAIVDNQNWRVENKGLMKGSFTFEGLQWSNEASI